LPKFGLEEINLAAMVDRQLLTKATVAGMATVVKKLMTNRMNGVGRAGLDILLSERAAAETGSSSSVYAQLDHEIAVCSRS
jgi:hypothetical protein